MDKCIENELEWLTGSDMVSACFSQKRWINKMKKLATTHENVTIQHDNEDGSICVHFPLEMLKISPKRAVQLTQEKKEELAERLSEVRKRGGSVD